jgi:predicted nucleic acid-binding protein
VYLVDTNIVSELMRPRPRAAVLSFCRELTRFSLSVIVVEEILYGLGRKPSARLETWFKGFTDEYCDILPVTSSIARRSGDLRARLATGGKTRTQADMLIAATAQEHGLVLVTRNDRDFQGCGLRVLNPFVSTDTR